MTAPAPEVGAALMYGGPKDGAKFPPVPGADGMPERIPAGGSGFYVRMDAMPGWMSFLPTRDMQDTIYMWEDAYVV